MGASQATFLGHTNPMFTAIPDPCLEAYQIAAAIVGGLVANKASSNCASLINVLKGIRQVNADNPIGQASGNLITSLQRTNCNIQDNQVVLDLIAFVGATYNVCGNYLPLPINT